MKRLQIPIQIYANLLHARNTPLQLTAEEKGGKAVIRIIGGIYEWENSSTDFRAKIDEMQERGIKDVHVYINSPGGDPFEAAEITNIIESFEGTITGEGGSLVASAATYIACKIKLLNATGFTMAKNGQFMYHKPMVSMFGKNADEVESTLKLLKSKTEEYAQVYADATGKTVEEIKAAWDKGDVWMSAKEAADGKFISGVKGEVPITAEDLTLLAACGAPTIPQIQSKQTPKNNEEDMKLSATALVRLGLTATATEQEIEARIEKLTQDNARLATLEAKATKDASDAKAAKIKAIVDKAIAEKKFTEDFRASFTAKLEGNFEVASAEIEAMKSVELLSNQIKPIGDSNLSAERKSWTYADWQEKDPETLNKMPKENPEVFKALYKDAYKVDAPSELFN